MKNSAYKIYDEIWKKVLEKMPKARPKNKKKLYYVSAEFMTGKLFVSDVIALGMYDEVKKELEARGLSVQSPEDEEWEPSLGNGGLGRLAACLMESAAGLCLNAEGLGINYRLGIFRQKFKDNTQQELPDPWMGHNPFVKKCPESYTVKIAGRELRAHTMEISLPRPDNLCNKICLFDMDGANEDIVKEGIEFDKSRIESNLNLFLYPDDSTSSGKLLRLAQEYFLSVCAAKKILEESIDRGCTLFDLKSYAVVQINDTHPTLIIPEMLRLIMEKGLNFDDALSCIEGVFAYTNHTILSEALERWPLQCLEEIAPEIVPIIRLLDKKAKKNHPHPAVSIIDNNNTVHMAHLDIHYCFSVNGVAALHTKILQKDELCNFHRIYPGKFNNKTNGISFSRWLVKCNPLLTEFIKELTGDGFLKNPESLERLMDFSHSREVLERLEKIKYQNKLRLRDYAKRLQNISPDPEAIFDIQTKRIHEYKRQQLNALFIISLVMDIRRGKIPKRPVCAIFGGKAAPSYTMAKDVIHLILCLSRITEQDPLLEKHLAVIMAENYNVTYAEHIIPSCDISEQISLASKEASGTGNMKFMLNGALTLGTEDGANAEIHSLVGDDNIYIFGMKAPEVMRIMAEGGYNPQALYRQNPLLREAVDFVTSREMLRVGDPIKLERLKNDLIQNDRFMTFPDFDDYCRVRKKALEDYEDRKSWAKKMLVNISRAGYFSADRTVQQYNKDIWNI